MTFFLTINREMKLRMMTDIAICNESPLPDSHTVERFGVMKLSPYHISPPRKSVMTPLYQMPMKCQLKDLSNYIT
jgi:hypothetical protein